MQPWRQHRSTRSPSHVLFAFTRYRATRSSDHADLCFCRGTHPDNTFKVPAYKGNGIRFEMAKTGGNPIMKQSPNNVLSLESALPFDIAKVRRDFPILSEQINGKPLVYLDNAASTQKPKQVIERIKSFYEHEYSNVHRGIHTLSQKATDAFEEARSLAREFLHAHSNKEIIFTRGTTEGINLVAQSFGRRTLRSGDEIIISAMEHHSNIVPWQMLCEQTGAVLKVIPMNMRGELVMPEFEKLLSPRVRLISVVHVSNALGTVNPVWEIIALAHKKNIPVLLDGAQSAPHVPVDVRELDCDFYVFSG